ncbi:MAG: hypothetical protein ACXAC7_13255, partial [Candidatus Hodarchaeales archaeon]
TIKLPLLFEINEADIHILFDETKNGLVNQKGGGLDDPWGEQAFLLGQYREFYKLLADNSMAVTPFQNGSYTNINYLSKFDVIIFPYPFTKISGTFTDWWNDERYPLPLDEPTLLMSEEEQTTLSRYLGEIGKGILVLTSPQYMNNWPILNGTAMNSWLQQFDIALKENSLVDTTVSTTNHPIFNGVNSINYFGTSFELLGNGTSLLDGKIILQSFESGGQLVLSGSAYFAENSMLMSSNSASNGQLILNLINWTNGNQPATNSSTVDEFNNVNEVFGIFSLAILISVLFKRKRPIKREKNY